MPNKIERPKSAFEVSDWSESLEDFGYNLKDWTHELKKISSKPQLIEVTKKPPPRLNEKFNDGHIADAFIAAYVHHLHNIARIPPPLWTQAKDLILKDPYFAVPFASTRLHYLIHTPPAFKSKNIFTTPDVTLKLHRGRPRVSPEHKRKAAALRQKRYRQRIAQELKHYRSQL